MSYICISSVFGPKNLSETRSETFPEISSHTFSVTKFSSRLISRLFLVINFSETGSETFIYFSEACISSLSVAKFYFWFCPVTNWTCILFQKMFDIPRQGMFPFFPRHKFHFRFDVCPVATWLRRFWRQHQQQPVTRGAGTKASHTP